MRLYFNLLLSYHNIYTLSTAFMLKTGNFLHENCFWYTPKEKVHLPERKKTAAGINRPKPGLRTFSRTKTASLGSIGKPIFLPVS